MNLHLVGCSHHHSGLEIREKLAFSPQQIPLALARLRLRFPHIETLLLSTCNRTELYTAADDPRELPRQPQVAEFFAEFHGLPGTPFLDDLFEHRGEDAVRHLFTVAASLDSMVIGEAQILSQVKQAYQTAREGNFAGPMIHSTFQAAMRVAKRVANETTIQQRRVSIASVAVGDFAQAIFERLDDKQILVIGAGEMAEETITYLRAAAARHITMINRRIDRAQELASRLGGQVAPWSDLTAQLIRADLVISTTGATEPIINLHQFQAIESERHQRPLFILDLAVPRDFDPAIGDCLGVYLYSLDDLQRTCEINRQARAREWPVAERIIAEETRRFLQEASLRTTAPTVKRLKENADQVKQEELNRLLNKLRATQTLDERSESEIRNAFDRLVNKILHPPLASLREENETDSRESLLDALRRLFQIRD